jgi:glucitol operon activator protein
VELLPVSLLLFGMFMLSMLGSFLQHRYYLRVVNDLARQFRRSGYALASGRSKGRTRGAIAVLVVRRDDPDVIERAVIMQGRTVFARFRERPELAGRVSETRLAACSPTMRRAVKDALQRGRSAAEGEPTDPVGAAANEIGLDGRAAGYGEPGHPASALSRSFGR